MKFSRRLRATIAVLSAAVGATAAVLPDDWIEQRFAVTPDGGNGMAEFLWTAAPLALAAILALSLLRERRRAAPLSPRAFVWGARTPPADPQV
ncbi:MAG TPA: hypothetical protein VN823_28525 [Stellaceae bacterium]|nr:hypothetical protein [Stellaceae bacterium]